MRSREVLKIVRVCLANGKYAVGTHVREQLLKRHLYWADVLAVIDDPSEVRENGIDDVDGWDKWVFIGTSTDGLELGVVVKVGKDSAGNATFFITVFHVR